MTYGIAIWGWKAAAKTIGDKFDKEIRKFGLMATRCQKSTSSLFVFNMLRTQSFVHILHHEVLKVSVNHFHIVDSKRKQVYETYQKNIKIREVPLCMDQYYFMLRRGKERILNDVEFDDDNQQYKVHPAQWALSKVRVHDVIQATIEGIDKRGWVIFTDASASSYGIGWGFAAFKNGYYQCTCYGSLTKCSIFMVEAYALFRAVKYACSIGNLGRTEIIEIHSDAQGLVKTLSKFVQTDTLLCLIKEELRQAYHAGKNIVLRWVPGHKGVTGNELADRLAKKAVDSKSLSYMRVTKKDITRFLKERETLGKRNAWETSVSRSTKLFLPDMYAVNQFIQSSPSAALCQLLSGHSRLNDFICCKLGLIRSPLCECGEDKETISHFLFDCPLYEELRWEVWNDFRVEYDFVAKDWGKLKEFVNKTNIFSRSIEENMGRIVENRGT